MAFPGLSGSNTARSSSSSSSLNPHRPNQIRRKSSVGNALSSLVNTVRTTINPNQTQSSANQQRPSQQPNSNQNNNVYPTGSRTTSNGRSSSSLPSLEEQGAVDFGTSGNFNQHNRFNAHLYNLGLANSPTVSNFNNLTGPATADPVPLDSSTPLPSQQDLGFETGSTRYRSSGTEANPIMLDYDSDINMDDCTASVRRDNQGTNAIATAPSTGVGSSSVIVSPRLGLDTSFNDTQPNDSLTGLMNDNSDDDNEVIIQRQESLMTPTSENVDVPRTSETNNNNNNNESSDTNKVDEDGMYSIRFTPFIDHSSSNPFMYFGPLIRRIKPGMKIPVGRYTEKCKSAAIAPQGSSAAVVFKSKVVSRQHAELSVDEAGNWFLRDVKSSSGTFLNHVRLSPANVESTSYPLNDSDILQLGMDYRGGSEDIYRCVKVKIELNSSWFRRAAKFNQEAHERLKKLTLAHDEEEVSPCAICLSNIKPCQAVFVSSCSHSWHYKCIRPIVVRTYPQFLCPNCKAVCDMEADFDEDEEEDGEGDVANYGDS
ncbi:hypothetical protein CANARDRAFT_27829 [[Candida] arabinofermentans NRRL YB-2248]|uniref:FHA domain-containing protein n=1 Tax=[Candida] arabinofermentans NRRL YB-2248 TaxID=983967 RepID=A0A1E4T1X5_9ASCO|nr:hypothetical protein CANARDRAFT_27829 [[Candida] arabinofermentans NRRL YB-2248]